MNKSILKRISLFTLLLTSFLIHSGDNAYNVNARVNSEDLPKAATILAEAFKNLPTKDALKTWQSTMRINTQDIEKALAAFSPTIHLGGSTMGAISRLSHALEQASASLSQTGSSLGLNAQTAALAHTVITTWKPEELRKFLVELKDVKVQTNHTVDVALAPGTTNDFSILIKQSGFIATGLISGVLSAVLTANVVNKHVNREEAPFSKVDGIATATGFACAVAALALIRYSALLAG